MKKWLCAVAVLAFISTTAFAQVLVDPYSYEVTVSGSYAGNADIMIALETSDAVSDENPPVWIRNFSFNGEFEVKPILSPDLTDGVYSVYINNKLLGSFDYMGKDSLDAYVKEVLSKSENENDLLQKIDSKKIWYGISDAELELIGESGLGLLRREMPFETKKDFVNGFFGIVVSKKTADCAAAAQVEEILKEYKDKIAIDYENNYEKLNINVKTKLCNLLAGADFSGRKFEDVFSVSAALAKCVCSQNYLSLCEELRKNESVLNLDLSAFSGDLAERCSLIIGSLGEVKNVNDLKTLIYNAPVSDKPSGGGGVKSGGGGGISIRPSDVLPSENERQTDEKNESEAVFDDMAGFEWANDSVKILKEKGIISGIGSTVFEPQRKITRAEFLKMAAKLFKFEGGENRFSDVEKNDWFEPFVSACHAAGIIEGYDNRIYPYENISREDAAVILHRAMKLPADGTENVEFSDETEVSDYAREAVGVLSKQKIITGYEDGSFKPHNEISRAEAAVLMAKCLNLWEEHL